MSIHRLNHAVLYVRDVERSVAFYSDVLGFTPIAEMGGGVVGMISAQLQERLASHAHE